MRFGMIRNRKLKALISVFCAITAAFISLFIVFYINGSSFSIEAAAGKAIDTYLNTDRKDITTVSRHDKSKKQTYLLREKQLFSFLEKHMLGKDGGIISNLRVTDENKGTLSESLGILMNYCVLRDKKALFDTEVEYLKSEMLVEPGLVKWKSGNANCNAVIDDLRIVRALLEGANKWGDKSYEDLALKIQSAILEKQTEDGKLYEIYDWSFGGARKVIPLCYADFFTMERLGSFSPQWNTLTENSLITIIEGKTGDASPIFNKYYDFQTGKYTRDEEYASAGSVNLVYNLYTVIHLAEINCEPYLFSEWLRNEMSKGRVYGWYNPDTLKPSNEMESTAVYALSAIYANRIGDFKLSSKLLDRMIEYMISNKKSPYFGGFGDERTGDFYSFDNLTALWALAEAA